MSSDTLEFVIFASVVVGFLAFLAGIIALAGRFSGWNRIAQALPPGMGQSLTSTDEKKFRFLTLRIGMSQYKGCVTASTSRYGLSLRLWPIFAFGHQQPLFIPWSEIAALEPQTFLGFNNGTNIKLRQPNLPTPTLSGPVFLNNDHVPHELQNSSTT